MTSNRAPIDVWLHFESETDEEPSHEANTFHTTDGAYCVESYHTAVGQVSRRFFDTYEEARAALEADGFQDFTA